METRQDKPTRDGQRFVLIRHDLKPRELFRGTASEILWKLEQRKRTLDERFFGDLEVRNRLKEFGPNTPVEGSPFDASMDLYRAHMGVGELEQRFPELELEKSDNHLRALAELRGDKFELIKEPPVHRWPHHSIWIHHNALMLGQLPTDPDAVVKMGFVRTLAEFGVTCVAEILDPGEESVRPQIHDASGPIPLRELTFSADTHLRAMSWRFEEMLARDEVVFLGVRGEVGPTADLLVEHLIDFGYKPGHSFRLLAQIWPNIYGGMWP